MRESALLRKIVAAVKEARPEAWVRKLNDSRTRGLPDLVILWDFNKQCGPSLIYLVALMKNPEQWPGRFLFVEVKRPDNKGRLSKLQAHEAETVNKLGVPWIVVSSVDEVLQWLR